MTSVCVRRPGRASRRTDGGRVRVVYLPELSVARTGDEGRDAWALTQAATGLIEGWVRKHPHAWLWFHERWKTRPWPEEEAVARGLGAEEDAARQRTP